LVIALLPDYEVIVAGSMAEGQRRALLERFDLYIFDYNLPDGTGIDLCLFIRAYDRKTPILVCTASPDLTDLLANAAGAQHYIKKGIDFITSLEAPVSRSFAKSYASES
jgi:DNA-binding response OmpR family regulator